MGNFTFSEFADVSHSTIGMCSKFMDTSEFVSVTFKDVVNNGVVMNVTLEELWVGDGSFSPVLAVGASNLSFAESIMESEF